MFFAFSFSVMPRLARVDDRTFVVAMQHANDATNGAAARLVCRAQAARLEQRSDRLPAHGSVASDGSNATVEWRGGAARSSARRWPIMLVMTTEPPCA
jgi:hypothetical protein